LILRRTVVALVCLMLASLGAAVPSVAAVSGEPKVVIIVGATHGVTSTYRTYADQAYAEALKYTSNVVKVYSPNATWARVKAAVAGASIVIYMGHGNGWPSPYTFDSRYTTKDGFGLNATAGAGDSNNVYYGEPYVSTLDLAPGAVILLHHLCYAAGNSEPGQAQPSVSVARQRVDNYAAGFLKAGAGAVIADGHAGPEGYLRALFTTPQPIASLWAGQPNANGNVVSFPSVRTPGAIAYQDPGTQTTGFYRSLVVRSSGSIVNLVTGAAGDPNAAPPSPAIPGDAPVAVDTTPSQLTMLTPAITTISWFSPNGDGNREAVTLTASTSEPGSVVATVRDSNGRFLRTWIVATAPAASAVTWDGRDEVGSLVPDGRYIVNVAPRDATGNTGAGEDRVVDVVGALQSVASSASVFFPQDLDKLARTTDLSFAITRPMTVTWTLQDTGAKVVDTHLAAVPLDAGSYTWSFDGRRSDGSMLKPGRYVSYVVASDGTLVAAQAVAFEADAFLIKPSDATPGRGQTITVTVTTAEPMSANPRLTVSQPGITAWSIATSRLSSTTYRATIKLKTGGRTGTVTFKATGKDIGGAVQGTRRAFPIH
jgi:flagellar hook assembly protein FlgD